MGPRLYRIIFPVNDIERGEEFFRNVLGMSGERISSGRHYFNLDGTILAVYDPVADGDSLGDGWKHHPFQYIYIAVDDLESLEERVRKHGGQVLQEIKVMPWGERSLYTHDPFGNPICFVERGTEFTGDN